MSYPICSVVAVFKPAPKPHLGYDIVSFFCVLAPHGMNEIVFGERNGERSEGRGLLKEAKGANY